SAVTGGAQLDGFVALTKDLLLEAGLPETTVFWRDKLDLPGYFRPEKRWDLLVIADGHLLAIIEFKSQVGPSFGNNYNNRTEESLGNATDLWSAYREGAFRPSQRPWLGYLMLLEEAPGSMRPVQVRESHFKVFEEFRDASYARRYEILLTRLLRERLYDGTCLLLSSRSGGVRGLYREPSPELGFQSFASSLLAHAIAFLKSYS
ncbi:MAG: restriction endonuclease, partial [Planctomycetes bacterium RBG_13_63_9]